MELDNNWKGTVTTDLVTTSTICVRCLICGESVELNDTEETVLKYGKSVSKVCGKCRNAVMKMREVMEQKSLSKPTCVNFYDVATMECEEV